MWLCTSIFCYQSKWLLPDVKKVPIYRGYITDLYITAWWFHIQTNNCFCFTTIQCHLLNFVPFTPKTSPSQNLTKFSHFTCKCWKTNSAMWKYCQGGFIWMVTPQDFREFPDTPDIKWKIQNGEGLLGLNSDKRNGLKQHHKSRWNGKKLDGAA